MSRRKISISVFILIFITSVFATNYIYSEYKLGPELNIKFPSLVKKETIDDIIKDYPDKMEVTIAATGDIMFHRPQVVSAYNQNSKTYNFYDSFSHVKKHLESADITIGNFETVTAGSEHGYTGYPRFNAPKTTIDALKTAGFDILSTANNHSLDRGKEGIIETIDNIKNYGLDVIGTYKEQTSDILIKNVKDINIAFLSYTYGCNGLESLLSKEELSYMVNIIEEDRIKNDIEKAKEKNADVIVVFIHWGNEYQRKPNQYQKELASKMFEWGADIILGSHPHVIQDSELIDYNNEKRFVIYSMGNFISNQRYETVQNKYTEDGVIVKIKIQKDLAQNKTFIKEVDFIPTWVHRYYSEGKLKYEILPIEDYIHKEHDQINVEVISRMEDSYKRTIEKIVK